MRSSAHTRVVVAALLGCLSPAGGAGSPGPEPARLTTEGFALVCDDARIVAAYEMARRVVDGNIHPWKAGRLESAQPTLMAGGGYGRPWTRDASYNTYFAAGLLYPAVARNTLLSVLVRPGPDAPVRIGGQYWDSIAWVTGAWALCTLTGDESFAATAWDASIASLQHLRSSEWDAATGLFCGPAWSDGVAGYPEPYNQTGGSSFILDYARHNETIDKIRMKALSTNCLYHNAYRLTASLGRLLGKPPEVIRELEEQATALKCAINDRLWQEERGGYAYFLDRHDRLDPHQEGLGQSLAILFGVADSRRSAAIFRNQYVSAHGIPCVWPLFPRFREAVGRHCGTIWPQIQGFWALAAASRGQGEIFFRELDSLTDLALSSGDFREIYHPRTGEPYGGMQCGKLWPSQPRQTWSATAYLAMIYQGLFGMRFDPRGIAFHPLLPRRLESTVLRNMTYRAMELTVRLQGSGASIERFILDGKPRDEPWLPAALEGAHTIEIQMR